MPAPHCPAPEPAFWHVDVPPELTVQPCEVSSFFAVFTLKSYGLCVALGGVYVLGYPVTRRFDMDGFVVQAFQKSVLQWRPERKGFDFLNTFDVLHDRGRDDWLQVQRQTPPPADTTADRGLPWDHVVARHVAMLDKVPGPLKDAFLGDPNWLDHYGLPVATQETDNSVVVRGQRAALQYWKQDVPWAARGSVTVANGGDLAKEAGMFPWQAVVPENAPR